MANYNICGNSNNRKARSQKNQMCKQLVKQIMAAEQFEIRVDRGIVEFNMGEYVHHVPSGIQIITITLRGTAKKPKRKRTKK